MDWPKKSAKSESDMNIDSALHISFADLLKVIFFARSEFTFIKFYAEKCAEIVKKKHIRFERTLSICDKNMKKCLFCKFHL